MAGETDPGSAIVVDNTPQQNGAKLQISSTLDPDHASSSNGKHMTVSLTKEPKAPSPAKENGSLHTIRPQAHNQQHGQPSTISAGPQAQPPHLSTDHDSSGHLAEASNAKQIAGSGAASGDKDLSHQHAPPANREHSMSRVDSASAASVSEAEAAPHPPSTRLLPAGAVAIPLPAVATSGSLPAAKAPTAHASTIHPVAAFQQLQYQQQQRQQQQQQQQHQSRQHSSGQSQTLFLPTIQQQLRLETQMRTQQAQQVQQAQQALQAGMGKQTSLQQHPHLQQAASLQQQAGQNRAGMHLLTSQQHTRLAVAMQPRLAPPPAGWPVPLPKTMTGDSCMLLHNTPPCCGRRKPYASLNCLKMA